MILSVGGIEFAYNGRPVLKDVTCEVLPGEILAVLGVNGAGKSTLLKCMNGMLKGQKGCVFLDRQEVCLMERNERARNFGYVPQHRGEEEMIVFDAVLLGRKPWIDWSASQRDLEIADKVIRLLGLGPLALRPLRTLSGGEAQKVLIARALAQEPEVLLLDEPTNSLDMKNQMEIMTLLKRVVREHKLIAAVSIHDLNLALRFADRFLMLKDGSVYAITEAGSVSREMIRDVYGIDVLLGDIGGWPVAVPVNESSGR
jgi:iron complex transport system ATP-binding protein